MKKLIAGVIIAVLVSVPALSYSVQTEPDVIYYNAKIVTFDPAESTASAVAVKDGKFLKVGKASEIKKLAGPSTRMASPRRPQICTSRMGDR